MSETLEELESGLERFLKELNRETLLIMLGDRTTPDSYSVFQKHSHLFDLFLISDLEEWRVRETGEKRKKLCQLHHFLRKSFPLAMVSGLTDHFESEVSNAFRSQGLAMRTLEDGYHFARSSDREARRDTWRNRAEGLKGLNTLLEKRLDGIHKASQELGYREFSELALEVRGIEIAWLTEALDIILERTETLYRNMLEELLEPMSLSLGEVEKHDILHLLSGVEFDHMFPQDQVWNEVSSAASGFGADLGVTGNLRLMSHGLTRSFALPVAVPDEVYLFVEPAGGYIDYLQHFGEAGRAIQMASISPHIPMEFRYLVDPAITESFALLQQRIISTRPWLEGRGDHDEISRFRRLFYLHRIYELRRLAALLQYELRLNSASLSDAEEMYRSVMDETMQFAHGGEEHMLETMCPFHSADRIRGFIFEAMLRKALLEKCGERWYSHPSARQTLSEIWSWGGKFSMGELANSIGYAELDIEPLVEEIEDRVRLL